MDLSQRLEDIKEGLEQARKSLNISAKTDELKQLEQKMSAQDFWNDNKKAQEISKQAGSLSQIIQPFTDMDIRIKELEDFIALEDESLTKEIEQKLDVLEKDFKELNKQAKYSGKYDSYNAIISIQAGAGGTDAQDWAEMLLRMYTKWAERSKYTVNLLDETAGDTAGIKNATLRIEAPFAYGKLKQEDGVHRLVRLSPFNSASSRETSFASVEVVPEIDKPDDIAIEDKDLKIDVYRASGHGGQSVNTTDSAVRVTHIPTGIVVAIQNERSQIQNKETALKILRSKLAQLADEQHQEKISELKGPSKEVAWGNQIRSYVLHPYKMVKDHRSNFESSDVDNILEGQIDELLN